MSRVVIIVANSALHKKCDSASNQHTSNTLAHIADENVMIKLYWDECYEPSGEDVVLVVGF